MMKNRLFVLLFAIAVVLLPWQAAAQNRRTLLLNGRWQAAVSDARPESYPLTVPVPGVMSQAEPDCGRDFDATTLRDDVGYNGVWYARDFELAPSADGVPFTRALLHLRAKYNATVFVNGVEIGHDSHTTYSHATFDVTRALHFEGHNRIEVRVGSWNEASFPSKDNAAEWWRTSRAPGICDDVTLTLTHDVAIRHIKVLPDVAGGTLACTVQVENFGEHTRRVAGSVTIDEASPVDTNGPMPRRVYVENIENWELPADRVSEFTFCLSVPMLRPWTPGREGLPQLYRLGISLSDCGVSDDYSVRFGFRDIRTEGRDVLLNGKKILFRAENIAFQRMLNRWADVAFDENWIRNFLRTVVDDYGFNYLRFHLGHAYSKWYDIADEVGIMIQDEWRFMHDDEPQGDDLAQTATEFRRWIAQNVNHPSIVAWDQENEGNVRIERLKAELRAYDPTRLWGEDDYDARHCYEYSETIRDEPGHRLDSMRPSTVLESCRLWLNEFNDLEPRESFKTSRTATAWGIFFYTHEEIEQLQADIHADLGTFYRAHRAQAWAPFALLSGAVNGHNLFHGDIARSLEPSTSLCVLARLNERLGASVDMNQAREWYKEARLYTPDSRMEKDVWVWNDTDEPQSAELQLVLKDQFGRSLFCVAHPVEVAPYASQRVSISMQLPRQTGCYRLVPQVICADGRQIDGVERRIMVAQERAEVDGLLGFGGHRVPFAGCCSVLENFTGVKLVPELQMRIVEAVGADLIDKAEQRVDGGFLLQTSHYVNEHHQCITTRLFDAAGYELSIEEREAMPYTELPESIRRTIADCLGTVPVDESKITFHRNNDELHYSVTMVGEDCRHIIRMTADGRLLGCEIVYKENK